MRLRRESQASDQLDVLMPWLLIMRDKEIWEMEVGEMEAREMEVREMKIKGERE